MASRFQQQALHRKLVYTGLILVLFTASLMWRRADFRAFGMEVRGVDAQAQRLSIREQSRGDVEFSGSLVRLSLSGLRGWVTCALWSTAMEKQKKNQWNELELVVRWLTKLQPHFITPWVFQSWNLSYNVSVELDRVGDKYFYITRGLSLLAEGDRQNHNQPELRWSVGVFNQHKIAHSDDTNVLRSLYQLSCIPPNERDPARFKAPGKDGGVNMVEFEKFCTDHPQLVRRLREGMRRGSAREQRRQFVCDKPDDVVGFLAEYQRLPSLYQEEPPPAGGWQEKTEHRLLPLGDRFPVLPPERTVSPPQHLFDPEALTDAKLPLGDDVDAYLVSAAWYGYAVEPLPDPDDDPETGLPGHSKPVTDPAHQRLPRRTTLIFRTHAPQAARFHAERLQDEGWFDGQPWDVPGWFREQNDKFSDGRPARVGGGPEHGRKQSSLEAWQQALRKWQRHGEENLLIFKSESAEQNMRQLAEEYAASHGLPKGAPVPRRPRKEAVSAKEWEQFHAYEFMFEYDFYRQLTNFAHHYTRARAESKEETVLARKLFYEAERLALTAARREAWAVYTTPAIPVAGRGRMTPIDVWKEKVLQAPKSVPGKNGAARQVLALTDFGADNFIQEQTAEIQVKYLDLYNQIYGREFKEGVEKLAAVVPLLPTTRTRPELDWVAGGVSYPPMPLVPVVKVEPEIVFPRPITAGPFDVTDGEGKPLIPPAVKESVLVRLHRIPAPKGGPPPGVMPPGRPGPTPQGAPGPR